MAQHLLLNLIKLKIVNEMKDIPYELSDIICLIIVVMVVFWSNINLICIIDCKNDIFHFDSHTLEEAFYMVTVQSDSFQSFGPGIVSKEFIVVFRNHWACE